MATSTRWKWLLGGAAVLVSLAGALALLPAEAVLGYATGAVRGLGVWAPAAYVGLYVLLAVAGVPSTPLNVGAGLLFGQLAGFVAAQSGAVISAMVAFLIARHLAGDRLREKVARHRLFDALSQAVEQDGFKVVLVARLNPFVHSSLKSYGFGLSVVSVRSYLAGTILGQVPIVLLHVYLGSVGNLTLFQPSALTEPRRLVFLLAGVVLSAILVWIVSGYGRRKVQAYQEAASA